MHDPVEILAYDPSTKEIHSFRDTPGIVDTLKSSGPLNKSSNELILLIHDLDHTACKHIYYHKDHATYYYSKPLMESLLRMHTVLTDKVSVLLVDWKKAVESQCTSHGFEQLMPIHYALNVELNLLRELDSNVRVHCIGASFGGYVCAGLGRNFQYRNKRKFVRIVALDTPDKGFGQEYYYSGSNFGNLVVPVHSNSKGSIYADRELSQDDADYVVSYVTSGFNGYGASKPRGHEVILGNLDGETHELCVNAAWWHGTICASNLDGVRHCETINVPFNMYRTQKLCSHLMAPVSFMKALDVYSVPVLIGKDEGAVSAWDAYSFSLDTTVPHKKQRVWLTGNDEVSMESKSLLSITSKNNCYFQSSIRQSFIRGQLYRRFYLTDKQSQYTVYCDRNAELQAVKVFESGAVMTFPDAEIEEINLMTSTMTYEYDCKHTSTYFYTKTKVFNCIINTNKYLTPRFRKQINATSELAEFGKKCYDFEVNSKYFTFKRGVATGRINSPFKLGYLVKEFDGLKAMFLEYKNYSLQLMSLGMQCIQYDKYFSFKMDFERNIYQLTFRKSGKYRVVAYSDTVKRVFDINVKNRKRREIEIPGKRSESRITSYNKTISTKFEVLNNKVPVWLHWYNLTHRKYEWIHALDNNTVSKMRQRGVFDNGRERDIIVLVHGWHGVQSSHRIFKQVLRHHQILTPNVSVIYVEWDAQGSNQLVLGDAAWSATTLNIDKFLNGINSSISNLHCVGHSLGGHACAAVCRHFYQIHGKMCTRIVSLDPASVMFKHNSPYNVKHKRINKNDAKYVAVYMTNRNLMGLEEVVGDEYITSNIDGWNSDACPSIGKYWGKICGTGYTGAYNCEDMDVGTLMNSAVIPHTKDSCSHMMAPIEFMKMLDIYNPISVFKFNGRDPKDVNSAIPSVWSSYVTSKDYRYETFGRPLSIWYSSFMEGYGMERGDLGFVIAHQPANIVVYGAKTSIKLLDEEYEYCLFLIPNGYDSYDFNIHSDRRPITARMTKPQGYSGNKSQFDKGARFPPMTSFAERVFKCQDKSKGNYQCIWSAEARWIPVYRSMLNAGDQYINVPPSSSCLESHLWFSDTLFEFKYFKRLSLHGTDSINTQDHFHDLFAVRYINKHATDPKNITIISHWHVCHTFDNSISFNFDQTSKTLNLTFNIPGLYDVYIDYQMKTTVHKYSINYKDSNYPHAYLAELKLKTEMKKFAKNKPSQVVYKHTTTTVDYTTSSQNYTTSSQTSTQNSTSNSTLSENVASVESAEKIVDEKESVSSNNHAVLAVLSVLGVLVMMMVLIFGIYRYVKKSTVMILSKMDYRYVNDV